MLHHKKGNIVVIQLIFLHTVYVALLFLKGTLMFMCRGYGDSSKGLILSESSVVEDALLAVRNELTSSPKF